MDFTRRNFLQTASLAGAGTVIPSTLFGKKNKKEKRSSKEKIKVGLLGVGLRGQNHLDLLLKREDCRVTAINDIDSKAIEIAKDRIKKAGGESPAIYQKGETDYLNLLEKESLDAVIISTPWKWHTPMACAAMEAGVYTGLEVSGAFSLEECWQLVNTKEKTGTELMFLENVCYRRDVMAIMNMVQQGLFGELIHLEGGYQHDLRHVKFNDGVNPYGGGVEFGEDGFSESKWRTQHSVHRNGDIYPTHGIGPVSKMLQVNAGNRFLYLTSMSTKSKGLENYVRNHPKGGASHKNSKVKFKLGDVVTTLIQTSQGESIMLSHDTNLPRPYSLGFRVQGTKGIWMDVNKSLHLEGLSPSHRWEEAESYLEKYDHPLWKNLEQLAIGAGHGGMDFFLMNAFVEAVKEQIAPPIDVYDAACWMAITPLSEASIAMGGRPMEFPDFTRGKWMEPQKGFESTNKF